MERWAAFAGIVFVAIFIVGSFLPGAPPMIDDSDAEIAEFYSDNRNAVLTGLVLQGLAVIPFLLFLSGLTRRLRRAEGDDATLSTTAYAAGVATVAVAFVTAAVNGALAYSVADAGDESHVRTLFDLQAVGNTFLGAVVATLVGAAAWIILRTRVFPAWFGWLSALGAIIILASAFSLDDEGFFAPGGGFGFVSLGVFAAWVLIASVLWLMGERTGDTGAMKRTTV